MKKILSLVLCVLMLLSVLPMTISAVTAETWDVLSFSQNGPEFSVVAEGFEATDSSYTFTAIASKSVGVPIIKTVTTTLDGGKLSASVNFEEGGVEADVNITEVEVTLTNSLGEVIGESKTFSITPQTITDGVYNNLTNGFYKPVIDGAEVTITRSLRCLYNAAGNLSSSWNEGLEEYDHKLNTSCTNAAVSSGQTYQFVASLSSDVQVDRVVAYVITACPNTEFYLAKTVDVASHLPLFKGSETTSDALWYLGKSSEADVVTTVDGKYRMVFNADGGTYRHLVTHIPGVVTGTHEFQPYRRVTERYTIASNKPASAIFKQEGATFMVTATKLEAAGCTLTAVAYDANGNRVGKKIASGTVSAGTFQASVDFEENGQSASGDINSVKLTLTDENGKLLANEKTFDVTKEVNSPLNGFYRKVDSVSYRDVYYYSTNGTTIGSATPSSENANKQADGDMDTCAGLTSPVPGGRLYMHGTELSTAVDVDMIVLDYKQSSADVYLSKNEPDHANLADFATKQTKSGIYYAGTLTNTSATVKRAILPIKAESGEVFRYVMLSASGGKQVGEVHEVQLYAGVKAEAKCEILTDGPLMGSATVFAEGNEVANKAPAFSYGSKNGSDASFAVDGDANTAWISANNGAYRDYLILDLGAPYIVDGLRLTMADGSNQNFTVYGMNTEFNSTRNSAISQNVSATEFKRIALTGKLSGISEGEEITDIKSFDKFRYLVFEQEAGAGTSFGFAEIEVFTLDEVVKESKPVSKAKGELVVFSRYTNGADTDTKLDGAKVPVTDSDPSTTAVAPELSAGWNEQVAQTVMIDLKKAQKVSYVAYQTASKEHPSEYTYFVLFGANTLPSTGAFVVKDATNKKVASLQNVDVLARFDGVSDLTATLSASSDETGLLIFEVPKEYQNKAYQYIGLMKYDTEGAQLINGNPQLKTSVGTLHAYTGCEDVEDLVAESGKNYIVDVENATVTDGEVSYQANLWNGNVAGNLIGILTNEETSQKYYVDCGVLVAGAYNSIGFTQTVVNGETGSWQLTLLCGNTIYDRIINLGTKKQAREELYTGDSLNKDIIFSRVGTTVQSSGVVDAGMVGMVILKPGADDERFSANDVYDLVIASAPAEIEGAWNYSLRYTVPADAEGNLGDAYIASLLSCNNSLTSKLPITIPVFMENDIEAAFAKPTADIATLVSTTYADFFGSELASKVKEITGDAATKEAFGKNYRLAKVGFDEDIFEADLSEIDAIAGAAQAAFVIHATISGKDVNETIAAYGGAMSSVFGEITYETDEFAEILPSVLPKLVTSTEATKENAKNLATAYQRAIALSLIANGSVAEREAAITNYSEALGILSATLNTNQEMGSIAQQLSSDMDTVKNSYASGINEIVKEIIAKLDEKANENNSEELGNRGNASIGGNAGGGLNAGSVITTPPYELWEEQVGGKQDGVMSDIERATGFADINAHVWAHEAIKRMKDKGIINGVSESDFDPDASLTREQAAKFVVLTMQLPTSMEDNGFLDCEYNSWYYPFVSSAVEHGLVNGVSMLEFGVGQEITRQDLAVIIYRGMKNLKLVDRLEKKSFADEETVSAYAKDAVAVLGNMGIITGFPDGSFGPNEKATRAQATVIFARFLDYVEAAANAGEEG